MKKICLAIVAIGTFIAGLLPNTASAAYTSEQAFSRMRQLAKQNKVPVYVVEKGRYKYVEGNSGVRVKGKNVFMRSQPLRNARVITKWTNTELEYLGEWTHPKNGERWICVRRDAYSEIGWIFGQYIEYVKENNSAQREQASNSNNLAKTQSGAKTGEISDEKHDYNINWSYVFWGIIILGIAYVITSNVLEWEFSIVNFFAFLIYAIFTVAVGYVVCMIAYAILKFVWEEIILPILGGLFLFFGLMGAGGGRGGSSSSTISNSKCCEYPNREYCRTCPLIDFSKESGYFSGYYWCRCHCAYVDPNYDAKYNSGNLKYS